MDGGKRGEEENQSLPCLWVVSQDVEEGVDAGFELPGGEYVREVGDVALPSAPHTHKKKNRLVYDSTCRSTTIPGCSEWTFESTELKVKRDLCVRFCFECLCVCLNWKNRGEGYPPPPPQSSTAGAAGAAGLESLTFIPLQVNHYSSSPDKR